jgi:hypothetical protein
MSPRFARLRVRSLEHRLVPTIITVTNTGDSGPGSLRQAVLDANAQPSADSIVFEPVEFATAKTIKLTTGAIIISGPVTISGPPEVGVVIDGGGLSRAFDQTGGALTLEWLSFTGCVTKGSGGAVYSLASDLTLRNCKAWNNKASGNGGAVVALAGGTIVLQDTTITDNVSTAGDGGGIYVRSDFATVSLERCTIANNTAGHNGGGVVVSDFRTFLVRNCTLSGNAAPGVSTGSAGAIFVPRLRGPVSIENSTIAFNAAGVPAEAFSAGGLVVDWVYSGTPPSVSIYSSIVYGNVSAGAPKDLHSPIPMARICCLVGDPGVVFPTPMDRDNLPDGTNPLLSPLADNGGPSPTHALSAGSPARDAGEAQSGILNDQRGALFNRRAGSAVDIGAFEWVPAVPSANMAPVTVTAPGGLTCSVTATYFSPEGISAGSLGTGDVRVVGPGGFDVVPVFSTATLSNTTATATYVFIPPGGAWSASGAGGYGVTVEPSQVEDLAGNAVPTGLIGSIRVAFAGFGCTYVVRNNLDAGPGSLREAVELATLFPGTSDTVMFDPGVFASPQTLTLTSGALSAGGSWTLRGPEAGQLTLSGGGRSRVVTLASSPGATVTLERLTFAQGFVNYPTYFGSDFNWFYGGAVFNADAALTVRNCGFVGNSAVAGGAIFCDTGNGSCFVDGSTFAANYGRNAGGAIFSYGYVALTAVRSIFADNTTLGGGGGGIQSWGPTTVEDCEFARNSTGGLGGALVATIGTLGVQVQNPLVVRRCLFVDNIAKGGAGGGVYAETRSSIVQNSTFVGNAATYPSNKGKGGGLYIGNGVASVEGCTLINNVAYQAGGGLYLGGSIGAGEGSPRFVVDGTMITGNNAAFGPDMYTPDSSYPSEKVRLTCSLIGVDSGFQLSPDSSGNLPFGAAPLMGNLADNGGPTRTIALLAGSPCINAGSNPAGLAYDQRGAGFNRVIGKAADIGAFEYQALPPVVAQVVVNGGEVQRSRVTSVRIDFDRVLNVPADAFGLRRTGDGAVVSLSASVVNDAATRVTLTFSGGPVEFGSLADGRYTLTASAAALNLDGNGDGIAGDDFTTSLHRLFGDNDGDGDVDAQDFGAFRAAFGGTSNTFDFDNDGDVDAADFVAFRGRFGASV